MYIAETRVNSEKASRYLVQLCKHFAHKTPAEYDETQGRVDFQPGLCLMSAADNELVVRCEAGTEPALARVKSIVEDHLVRFAWREKIGLSWDAPVSGGAGSSDA
jgi:hypothetical protein